LLRLGWAYKDKEIFSLDESIKLFDLKGVGKSPSKLDMSRILSLNEHYIKNIDEKILFEFLKKYAENYKKSISSSKEGTILKSLNFLKNKAKTLDDIYQNAQYILNEDIKIAPEDIKLLDTNSKKIISEFLKEFKNMNPPNKEGLEKLVNSLINKNKTNFKGVGQPLRIALVGSRFGPGIYNIILSLTKDEVVKRISKFN
jgi:Glutamyl- and glutaminyl-tRNA synthetases